MISLIITVLLKYSDNDMMKIMQYHSISVVIVVAIVIIAVIIIKAYIIK